MTTTIQITIPDISPEESEILVAQLAEIGYEAFEENENRLDAFISESAFDEEILQVFLEEKTYQKKNLQPVNWNQQWESSFEPVVLDDFCAVRAAFHTPVTTVKHEIIITPKQSFGTGHHATTYMMLAAIRDLDMTGKSVFDFGTGTGVLAILAEKTGAASILAIDNDEWSIENARENIGANQCHKIEIRQGDEIPGTGNFDIILANINKHIITAHFSVMTDRLKDGGILVLSGLLEEDEADIQKIAREQGIHHRLTRSSKGWISLIFNK